MSLSHYNKIYYEEFSFSINDLFRFADYLSNSEKTKVMEAYEFARDSHKGQKRESDEEYVTHPLSVAIFLSTFNADYKAIIAALLHDVLEDTEITPEQISEKFGEEVLYMVESLTKVSDSKTALGNGPSIENFKKMLLGTVRDFRIVLIKLCDRLHNLITLKYLPREKQERIARETLSIYSPLAAKLGVYRLKDPLEDLSFKYLYPDDFQRLKKSINLKREKRIEAINKYIKKIEMMIAKYKIEAIVFGRVKSLYSTYKKLKNFDKNLDDVYDLFGIRVITNNVSDVYNITKIILSKWPLKKGRFKDYIKDPKASGYKSIHVTLEPEENMFVEVQIRTRQMDYENEYGIAAHWRYKGAEENKEFDKKIAWLKQVIDWKNEYSDKNEYVRNLKVNLFEDEVLVLTPKGEIISLPKGSTPIDFAYHIHTIIGDHCRQAKVNGKIVPLSYELKNNDIVEIITSREISASRQWLTFAKSNHAKQKIRRTLNLPLKKRKHEEIEESEMDLVKGVIIEGKLFESFRLAGCCLPEVHDDVIAVEKNNEFVLHKSNCPNLFSSKDIKPLKAKFILRDDLYIKVRAVIDERTLKLKQILNAIAKMNLNIIHIKTYYKHNKLQLHLDFEPNEKLNEFLTNFKKQKGVYNLDIINEKLK